MILLDFGGKVKGDSQIDGHEDWIQCESAQLGVGRAITTTKGTADRETSDPSFSEVSLTKQSDKASVDLFIESAGGKKPQKAVINFVNTKGDAVEIYMTWTLHNALVSGYSISSGGERPVENISLNFTKIEVGYNRFDPGGKVEKISPKGWDISLNKQL